MELWQTYHEISKRFHLTADNWGVTKKSVVSQFSSSGEVALPRQTGEQGGGEYPQGEVVAKHPQNRSRSFFGDAPQTDGALDW
nr:MAG TPA: hypothetical protein [Caudoviricetes sp.]